MVGCVNVLLFTANKASNAKRQVKLAVHTHQAVDPLRMGAAEGVSSILRRLERILPLVDASILGYSTVGGSVDPVEIAERNSDASQAWSSKFGGPHSLVFFL